MSKSRQEATEAIKSLTVFWDSGPEVFKNGIQFFTQLPLDPTLSKEKDMLDYIAANNLLWKVEGEEEKKLQDELEANKAQIAALKEEAQKAKITEEALVNKSQALEETVTAQSKVLESQESKDVALLAQFQEMKREFEILKNDSKIKTEIKPEEVTMKSSFASVVSEDPFAKFNAGKSGIHFFTLNKGEDEDNYWFIILNNFLSNKVSAIDVSVKMMQLINYIIENKADIKDQKFVETSLMEGVIPWIEGRSDDEWKSKRGELVNKYTSFTKALLNTEVTTDDHKTEKIVIQQVTEKPQFREAETVEVLSQKSPIPPVSAGFPIRLWPGTVTNIPHFSYLALVEKIQSYGRNKLAALLAFARELDKNTVIDAQTPEEDLWNDIKVKIYDIDTSKSEGWQLAWEKTRSFIATCNTQYNKMYSNFETVEQTVVKRCADAGFEKDDRYTRLVYTTSLMEVIDKQKLLVFRNIDEIAENLDGMLVFKYGKVPEELLKENISLNSQVRYKPTVYMARTGYEMKQVVNMARGVPEQFVRKSDWIDLKNKKKSYHSDPKQAQNVQHSQPNIIKDTNSQQVYKGANQYQHNSQNNNNNNHQNNSQQNNTNHKYSKQNGDGSKNTEAVSGVTA